MSISGDYEDYDIGNFVETKNCPISFDYDYEKHLKIITALMVAKAPTCYSQSPLNLSEDREVALGIEKNGSIFKIIEFLYHLLKPGQLH